MSLQRASSRFFLLFAGVSLLATTLFIPAPAQAHEVEPPPFDLTFPQETSVTEFSSTFGARRRLLLARSPR